MVSAFQTQLPRPGGDDGGTRPATGSPDNHALGAPLCAGVRAPLEPVRPTSRVIMACRRDLRELLHRIHKGPFNLGRLRRKTEVRLPSGTRYWQPNKIAT